MNTDELVTDVMNGFSIEALSITAILRVAFTIIVGIIVIRLLMRIVDRALERSHSINAVSKYIRSVINVALWFMLVLTVVGSLGVDITSLIALFSVAGLAVSLAMQNTLANLAGGIMVLVTKPFEVGDYVETNGVGGTVEAIGLAYSTLATADNKEVFIPNSEISSAKIVNYTRLGSRRLDMTFAASYDAPTETVKKALYEVIARYPQIKAEPAPVVYLTKYGASSIEYQLRGWVEGSDYWNVYFGIMEDVRAVFQRHGIEMTYDHLNVHVVEK